MNFSNCANFNWKLPRVYGRELFVRCCWIIFTKGFQLWFVEAFSSFGMRRKNFVSSGFLIKTFFIIILIISRDKQTHTNFKLNPLLNYHSNYSLCILRDALHFFTSNQSCFRIFIDFQLTLQARRFTQRNWAACAPNWAKMTFVDTTKNPSARVEKLTKRILFYLVLQVFKIEDLYLNINKKVPYL